MWTISPLKTGFSVLSGDSSSCRTTNPWGLYSAALDPWSPPFVLSFEDHRLILLLNLVIFKETLRAFRNVYDETIQPRMFFLGVPAELPAQRPAGRHKGLVQRGAALGSSANPDSFETQAEGGQTPGKLCLHIIWMYVNVLCFFPSLLRTVLIIVFNKYFAHTSVFVV